MRVNAVAATVLALFRLFIIQKDADNNQWPSVPGGSHAGKHANVTRARRGGASARVYVCVRAMVRACAWVCARGLCIKIRNIIYIYILIYVCVCECGRVCVCVSVCVYYIVIVVLVNAYPWQRVSVLSCDRVALRLPTIFFPFGRVHLWCGGVPTRITIYIIHTHRYNIMYMYLYLYTYMPIFSTPLRNACIIISAVSLSVADVQYIIIMTR